MIIKAHSESALRWLQSQLLLGVPGRRPKDSWKAVGHPYQGAKFQGGEHSRFSPEILWFIRGQSIGLNKNLYFANDLVRARDKRWKERFHEWCFQSVEFAADCPSFWARRSHCPVQAVGIAWQEIQLSGWGLNHGEPPLIDQPSQMSGKIRNVCEPASYSCYANHRFNHC